MSGEYDGLVAVVTGGASGIGASIAQELSDRGAKVAVFDLDPSGVPEGMLPVRVNVADDDSVRAGVEEVIAGWGQIDVLVNNAGIGAQGAIDGNDDEEWHRVLDVNVVGMVRVSRAALPHLRQSSSAAIVNVVLDRGDRRTAPASALQRQQGSRAAP